MVISGRRFYCDSLRDNTKGSGKKLVYPKRHGVHGILHNHELSRGFTRSIGQQAGRGGRRHWAGKGKGSSILARHSHCTSALSEKASKGLNI